MSTDEIINYYLLPITAAGIFWTTLVLTTRGGSIVCAALLFTVVFTAVNGLDDGDSSMVNSPT